MRNVLYIILGILMLVLLLSISYMIYDMVMGVVMSIIKNGITRDIMFPTSLTCVSLILFISIFIKDKEPNDK